MSEQMYIYWPQNNSMDGVLPQKLTGPQPVKFPSVGDTCMFITTLTSANHLSLSWTKFIQSMPPHLLLEIHFAVILPSMPSLPSVFIPSDHPTKRLHISPLPYMPHAPPIWFWFDLMNICWGVQIMNLTWTSALKYYCNQAYVCVCVCVCEVLCHWRNYCVYVCSWSHKTARSIVVIEVMFHITCSTSSMTVADDYNIVL